MNKSTSLCPSEKITNPTKYLFLIMYPSTNTRSGPTNSTETTTLDPDTSNSCYVTQTDFTATIKYQMYEFKESVKEIISNQDAKIVKKIEEELQPMSLHIKDNFVQTEQPIQEILNS